MESLLVIHGKNQGCRYELPYKDITIGREPTNIIQLQDRETSRRHALIRFTESGRKLCDLHSSNGVYLNGIRINEEYLHNGDQFQIGGALLLYSVSPDKMDSNYRYPSVHVQDEPILEERSKIIHSLNPDHNQNFFRHPSLSEGSIVSEGLLNAHAHLNLMYHTTLVISQTLDINHLLQRIMDLIFEWVDVDRGCILLYDSDSNKLTPHVSKLRSPRGQNSGLTISRTILDYVIRTNEGVLTSNAQSDERWNPEESIVKQGIKEAICVPMQGRYGLTGVIYIDTSCLNNKALTPEKIPSSYVQEAHYNSSSDSSSNSSSDSSGSGTAEPLDTIDTIDLTNPTGVKEDKDQGSETFQDTAKLTLDHLKLMMVIGHQAALAVEDTRYYQGMVQGERLAAVGQTVAVLSHHIKNILQGINGGGYLIDQGLKIHDEDMIHKGWRIVEKNQGRISDLIMDMLTFCKERVPILEESDLNLTVKEVIELMQGRAEELKIKLEFVPDPSVSSFFFDKDQIDRALINLVTNALEAVHEAQIAGEGDEEGQDTLTMPLNDIPERGKVLIQTFLSEQNETIMISVDDNGKGVPLEMKEALFRPFFSKNKSMGTGIGLAVTHKIIEEHNGRIDIEKSPLGGARFRISLPFLRTRPEAREEKR